MNVALLIPDGDTLVTYYMLPLIGLNRKSFGSSFKTSYIDKEGLRLYVELRTNMKVPSYKRNSNYITEAVHNGNLFVLFTITSSIIPDAKLFIAGRYSEISRKSKNTIYLTSTLPYNKAMGDFKMSNPILQALDKTKTLRDYLESTLGIKSLPDSVELIQSPDKAWFIENRLK